MTNTNAALSRIYNERVVQKGREDLVEMDCWNTRNDYIAYVIGYLGRASGGMDRNEREGLDPIEMLVKAGALIVAAIEAEEKQRIADLVFANLQEEETDAPS